MIRAFLAGVLLILHGVPARAAQVRLAAPQAPVESSEQGQLDVSPALFSVLAAINIAGYDADLESPANSPLRQMVRQELAAKKIACLDDLKFFFAHHRQKDWSAELSQYISFALSTTGPPDFKYRFLSNQLPPDVVPLEGFETLMARFCKDADIAALWQKLQPAFDQALKPYHGPASKAVLEVNAYLKSSTSGYLGRRFQIYVDVLGAPYQVHTRSYAQDYFIVLTPSPESRFDEIRHAYLHYMIDPLGGRYREEVDKKKPLIDFAQGAPILEDYYKNDFVLLTTESLIKAIEARLDKKPALVDQALKEGFILAPYFAEALPVYEHQEQSMRFYFPELVKGIDLRKETARLDKVQFATERPVRKVKVVPAERPVELTGARKTLQEAEQFYVGRDFEKASQAFRQVLTAPDEKGLHARAYFGLARIAALQRDPETSQKLFEKTLESSPDPDTRVWSLVYLGRLADAQGDRETAKREYQAALDVQGGSARARQAAQQGLQEGFKKK